MTKDNTLQERTQDIRFMKQALRLAESKLGMTTPHPTIGCVIVKDNKVISTGTTTRASPFDAETSALKIAKKSAEGATMYLTLEPSHTQDPSLTIKAFTKAKLSRVVIAIQSPEPVQSNKVIEALTNAGIQTEVGVCKEEAYLLNMGFFLKTLHKRPMISLLLVTSLDAKLFSGDLCGLPSYLDEASLHYMQYLRKHHDGVMVDIQTILSEDPLLNTLESELSSAAPVRIIADPSLQLPTTSRVATTATQQPLWLLTLQNPNHPHAKTLEKNHVNIYAVPEDTSGMMNLKAMLETLAASGITRLLVEAGNDHLAASLLQHRYVDQIIWVRSPVVLGELGTPIFDTIKLKEALHFTFESFRQCGNDRVEWYKKPHQCSVL